MSTPKSKAVVSFSTRLPPEIYDALVRKAEDTGRSKADLVADALARYLKVPRP